MNPLSHFWLAIGAVFSFALPLGLIAYVAAGMIEKRLKR